MYHRFDPASSEDMYSSTSNAHTDSHYSKVCFLSDCPQVTQIMFLGSTCFSVYFPRFVLNVVPSMKEVIWACLTLLNMFSSKCPWGDVLNVNEISCSTPNWDLRLRNMFPGMVELEQSNLFMSDDDSFLWGYSSRKIPGDVPKVNEWSSCDSFSPRYSSRCDPRGIPSDVRDVRVVDERNLLYKANDKYNVNHSQITQYLIYLHWPTADFVTLILSIRVTIVAYSPFDWKRNYMKAFSRWTYLCTRELERKQ